MTKHLSYVSYTWCFIIC